MNIKILAGLEFSSVLNEAAGQTQSGKELLDKYRSFLTANNASCNLVNSFVKEAANYLYDKDVNSILSHVSDYISMNKTSWALASACESINNNQAAYNYLHRNAAQQVESLLEADEETVVKYIKAGALKNVMFCEAFRNIAKQVYADNHTIENEAEYTAIHPISIIESAGDGFFFSVAGTVYKIDESKKIQEVNWNEVSGLFKSVMTLLENSTVNQNDLNIKIGNGEYTISENEEGTVVCKRTGSNGEQTIFENVSQLREHNRLVIAGAVNKGITGALEALALTFENYNNIVNLDNVTIYTTPRDKFVVIEGDTELYATLLQSNHNTKWTVNENAITTLSFIKSKTNVELGEQYASTIQKYMANIDEEEKKRLAEEVKINEKNEYRERIAALTEKFKNDPAKLAILSSVAAKIEDAI